MTQMTQRSTSQKVFIRLLVVPIYFYRWFISPLLGPSCRFIPTCSHYALTALYVHGPVHGLFLTLRRLARCHPWGRSGYDPVPHLPFNRLWSI